MNSDAPGMPGEDLCTTLRANVTEMLDKHQNGELTSAQDNVIQRFIQAYFMRGDGKTRLTEADFSGYHPGDSGDEGLSKLTMRGKVCIQNLTAYLVDPQKGVTKGFAPEAIAAAEQYGRYDGGIKGHVTLVFHFDPFAHTNDLICSESTKQKGQVTMSLRLPAYEAFKNHPVLSFLK